ncbi:uncharacterized protein EKO05_0002761 [Ascochyta rabiei]|uniref:uncharacterized protein n=1 Tax=Didymella rabiei TaxID=5454 RepID=UPI00220092A2|nr:uncharacterized protein EKO05_0002761 [Ascochyta rabiei]UPX12198.1 hypothetical protein EKO05_0002761 [Ascochyta rabiei]
MIAHHSVRLPVTVECSDKADAARDSFLRLSFSLVLMLLGRARSGYAVSVTSEISQCPHATQASQDAARPAPRSLVKHLGRVIGMASFVGVLSTVCASLHRVLRSIEVNICVEGGHTYVILTKQVRRAKGV